MREQNKACLPLGFRLQSVHLKDEVEVGGGDIEKFIKELCVQADVFEEFSFCHLEMQRGFSTGLDFFASVQPV